MTSNSKVNLQELFNGTELATTFPDNEKWYSLALDQYKLYVEMADRISQRRATANTYFLSVNSAILAFVGYLTSKDSAQNMWLLAFAGVLLCLLWEALITSYRNLNTAKFQVIHAIENRLPIRPYKSEWSLMGEGKNSKLYRPISHIERGVPWVFAALHAIVLAFTLPWHFVSLGLSWLCT